MSLTEAVVLVVILAGVVGIVVPVLPGTLLVGIAILAWAAETGGATAWAAAGTAVGVLVLGTVVKYAVPGRRLREQGVPSTTLVAGGVVGLVGFFVVPVVGLFLGFVLGIYAAERVRLGGALAWPATRAALRAVATSVLIEVVAALLATAVWGVGVTLT